MALAFAFDHVRTEEPRTLTALLGGKGANLAQMASRLNMPVPPGFTVTTAAWRAFEAGGWPEGLDEEIRAQIAAVERRLDRRFGDPAAPLLLSVRSGAPQSMPGMMDTILNLGAGETTLPGLTAFGGEVFALDTYRRFLSAYAGIVLGIPPAELDSAEASSDPATLRAACDDLLARIEAHSGRPLSHDPWDHLRAAVEAVFRSWHGAKARSYRRRVGLRDDLGTAANVQAMVLGNKDARSATGVVFTRNPATGENCRYGDVLFQAQGEDVVSGAFITEPYGALADRLPEAARELEEHLDRLEGHYRDMCDVEFTVESGKLWILQTRVGKRSPAAAIRIAVDMTRQPVWSITREEALARVTDEQLHHVLEGAGVGTGAVALAQGLGASPGVATGRAYFTADSCMDAADRGEDVVLVRRETSPEDVHGMQVAKGILTTHGGLVSHAAVVAREWGIPAVVGLADASAAEDVLTIGTTRVNQGDVITIDGESGRVYHGEVANRQANLAPEVAEFLSWREA